ncbi:hypothetical protein J5N97_012863 [Dioscorea zingiberensis]|uniref:Urease accessory protein F n=1 Tax=Dioscorea zingiberensis TaxID=325984 RepID=A0A9D5HI69_9LILI|nr:hypothetical protein J5N97_012863 [Dioscorea zingiberensis]
MFDPAITHISMLELTAATKNFLADAITRDSSFGEDIALPNNIMLQWSQWQLLDSILPTGGFAHSYGLEASFQARFVLNPEDLKSYVIQVLENTGSLLLPFVCAACKSPDTETWLKLDRLLEATLTNEVSRKASVSQGSALMRVAASVYMEIPLLKKIREMYLASGLFLFTTHRFLVSSGGFLVSTVVRASVLTCS